MARKPEDFEWLGFTAEQRDLLDRVDFISNNGWARTPQTESMMPALLGRLAEAGTPIGDTVEAMRSIGHSKRALHQLERWESKRMTGQFGR